MRRMLRTKQTRFGGILIAYIIIGALLLSLLSLILYRQFEESSISDINEISERKLIMARTVTDLLLRDVHRTFFNLQSDTLIFDAFYGTSFTSADRFHIVRTLRNTVLGYEFVHSAYVFNAGAGLMFSSDPHNVAVSSADAFFDPEIVSLLWEADFRFLPQYIPRTLYTKIGTQPVEIPVLTQIFTEPSLARRPHSALIVNIHQEPLQRLIAADSQSTMVIFDSAGLCISHSLTDYIGQPLAHHDYVARVLASENEYGSFTAMIDGRQSLVSYVKAPRLGWHFISISDYTQLFERVTALQVSTLAITGLFILLAIAVAAVFSWRIRKPFDQLHADMSGLLPAKRSETLKQLLLGDFTDTAERLRELDALGIRFHMLFFTVCVFRFDSYAQLCLNASPEECAHIRYTLMNHFMECFSHGFTAEITEGRGDHMCAIINHDGTNPIETLLELLHQVRRKTEDSHGLSCTIGVSAMVTGLGGIRGAYEHALEITEYRIRFGKGQIILETELEEPAPYEYPFATEKGLTDALRGGSPEEAALFINRFFESVERFVPSDIHLAVTQLSIAMTSIVRGFLPSRDFKNINQAITACDTLDEIRGWFLGLCHAYFEAHHVKRELAGEEVIRKMVGYIEAHFQNMSLTVEDIAAVTSLSPNYARTKFKEATGKSISGYIAELRFNKAGELLRTTGLPAGRIASLVGFENAKYFYGAFKKHFGMTPGEYRDGN